MAVVDDQVQLEDRRVIQLCHFAYRRGLRNIRNYLLEHPVLQALDISDISTLDSDEPLTAEEIAAVISATNHFSESYPIEPVKQAIRRLQAEQAIQTRLVGPTISYAIARHLKDVFRDELTNVTQLHTRVVSEFINSVRSVSKQLGRQQEVALDRSFYTFWGILFYNNGYRAAGLLLSHQVELFA